MNDRLTADLGRWERGELRSDELARCHPDGEPDELLQMHARVSLAMSATAEEPDLGWEEIEVRLALDLDAEAERDDELGSRRRRVPVLKLVIAFVAGALVNPFQPADRAIDGLRAVARSTGHAVVEEVTDVFEPMIPPRTAGVLVLDPGNTQNLSAVTPEASPPPSGPAQPGTLTSDPEPQPVSERHDVVTQDPVESDEPAAAPTEPADPGGSDEPEETTAPSDSTPEPDHGPLTPPGQERGAERSPTHGGEKAEPTPPGHTRQPTSPPGHAQRPAHAGASAPASSTPDPGPPSEMAGEDRGPDEHPGEGHRGAGDRRKGPR